MDVVEYFLLPVPDMSIAVVPATPSGSKSFVIVCEQTKSLVSRLLGATDVALVGTLSPVAPVTLPDDAKSAAGIPHAASFFAYAYPLQQLTEAFDSLMKTVFSSVTHNHDDERLMFMLLGGFCYFDGQGTYLQCNALSLKPSKIRLWLEGPFPASEGAIQALRARDRIQPVRTKALRRGGVEEFGWVHPRERPGKAALCAHAVSWEHGALVFGTDNGPLFYCVRPTASSSDSMPIRADGGHAVTAALRTMHSSYEIAAKESLFLKQDLAAEKVSALERWLRAYGGVVSAYYGIGILAYGYLEGFGLLDTCYFLTTTATTVGYGDFCPSTVAGRLLTALYAPLGTIAVMSAIVPAMDTALEHLDLVTTWLVIAMHQVWTWLTTLASHLGLATVRVPAKAAKLLGQHGRYVQARRLTSAGGDAMLQRAMTVNSLHHHQFCVELRAIGRAEAFVASEPLAYLHALLAPLSLMLIGVATAVFISGRSLTDAIYFSAITMTTVGCALTGS